MKPVIELNERGFPLFAGEALAWDVGLYTTPAEAEAGYPRARVVIAAMSMHRPEQLERERAELRKASFDRLFGHNAMKELRLIDAVLSERKGEQAPSSEDVPP